MRAEAWGAQHHEKDHILAEGAELKLDVLATDGSLSVTFKTTRPFGKDGEYFVRLTFTAAEIDKMHRQSYAGSSKGLTLPSVDKSTANFEIKRRV